MAAEGNTYTGFLYAGLMITNRAIRRLLNLTAALAIRKPADYAAHEVRSG